MVVVVVVVVTFLFGVTTDQAVEAVHTTIPAPPQNVVISGLLIVMVMVTQ